VKNLELVQDIDRAITERTGPVRFRWVRGHVGNHFNEMADKLAGEAARAVANTPEKARPWRGLASPAVEVRPVVHAPEPEPELTLF